MYNERLITWINGSTILGKIEPFMIPATQGIGNLDIKLIKYDKHFCELVPEKRSTIEVSLELTDHMTQSYLWVLGTYEIIRSVSQYCRENPLYFGDNTPEIHVLKHEYERLRIPLAKFEPSQRHKNTDSHIAYPAIHNMLGASWHVAENIYISRRQLSDAFLDFLQHLAE